MTTAYDDVTIGREESQRKPSEMHPRGSCKAVCVDVIDLGEQENTFKKNTDGTPVMEPRLRIVFETSRTKSDGTRFHISKSYKKSLYSGVNGGNPAALYVHLSSWLGESWDGQFRSELIVGRPAELFIEHEKGRKEKTKIFAKILAIHSLEPGEEFRPSGGYKRFVPKQADDDTRRHNDDEEIPF